MEAKNTNLAGWARFAIAAVSGAFLAMAAPAFAQDAPVVTVDPDGTVHTPPLTVPVSSFLSPQGKAYLADHLNALKDPERKRPIAEQGNMPAFLMPYLKRVKEIYPTDRKDMSIQGVPVYVYTPKAGVAPENANRVLINLHGGGFAVCFPGCAEMESIPVAGTGGFKVVSVDYRQGPEHVFPAASEDVEAVYRALLKQYPAKNIGIYGCSAGGVLTGEAVARIISKKLPVPGAIGTFCGSLSELAGDSTCIAPVLNGDPSPAGPLKLADLPYFKGASASDPLVFPVNSPALLAKFPPTLLITGTRDFTMSSVLHSQLLLTAAGVDAELHVWDGMWHSFFSDPEMPESREAYAVMVSFFDRRLGSWLHEQSLPHSAGPGILCRIDSHAPCHEPTDRPGHR